LRKSFSKGILPIIFFQLSLETSKIETYG